MTNPSVKQYAPVAQAVYRAAVHLAQLHPNGFTVQELAEELGCSVAEAEPWVQWLRKTGDFAPPRETAYQPR